MNRIDKTLADLKAKNKKMLSPYITAGDPKPELTVPLMHALVSAGADIIELGVPFSDPMAEGPVIQAAMERALANQVTTDTVFAMVKAFREQNNHTPIILMGYLNPIEQYGYEAFAEKAKAVGVDGTIIVDLPPEESETLASVWRREALSMIYLCSPTTTAERMALINHYGQGYLYYVSLKGVTGSSDFDLVEVKKSYGQRKSQTQLPLMVGFGIKTAKVAAEVAQFADGIIVGAALVQAVFEAYTSKNRALEAANDLIHAMRLSMDNLETNYD
jgi:tryptophan synthase alpha chain